jgi:signal peptidase I
MKEQKPILKEILEWIYCILIAIALALLIRYYVGTPTIVQMPSMNPTLKQGERLLLNRWVRTVNGEYKRGDIITFESPSNTYISEYDVDENNPVALYENEPSNIFTKFGYYVLEFGKTSFIKRVIATEGEHIKITEGKVYINGEELEETYLQPGVITDSLGGAYTDLVVPQGYMFVMGDNRAQSTDSRRFGCIPIEKVESKVLIRFWPLNLFGKVE